MLDGGTGNNILLQDGERATGAAYRVGNCGSGANSPSTVQYNGSDR